ncbi:MarR family transcriptional regulator [Thioclava sp.]|uniref:MarR family transcriptional regulator n=1 Tax=Thioclava sp. TaxID=1933450 RepID=UPI003AA88E2A
MSQISVLTGDLVASSRLSSHALDGALDAVKQASADLSPAIGATRFARNRGDGWQIALGMPRFQARLPLMIRAHLRALGPQLSTRIAIAQGAGSLPAGDDLNAAHGPVFTASGQLLDTLEGPRIAYAGGGALGAALRLFDHISQGWTQAQARAMVPMLRLDPPTQTAAAAEIAITRQSLAQALQGAGYEAILEALQMIEERA